MTYDPISELRREIQTHMAISHERHQQIIERLHALEIAFSTRMTDQGSALRREMAEADKAIENQLAELKLALSNERAARYRHSLMTILSMASAIAMAAFELFLKKVV